MKIRVTFKDPDTMQDAVDDAFNAVKAPSGITAEEWRELRSARADAAKSDITD